MGKSEGKGEFESPESGFLGLKGGTPIILGPWKFMWAFIFKT
jgi:hypothetical protein